MSLETLDFAGLPNCLKLSNGTVDLIVTTAVGPRILFYGPTGGKNLLALHPNGQKETALGTWKVLGGHRLWCWPEVFPATYAPDNSPVPWTTDGDLSITLRQPVDAAGIEKHLRITLASSGTQVTLDHTLTSHCLWPVDIAVWAITVCEVGASILPRVPFRSHDDYVPVSQPLALCAFTNLQDPRFSLGLKYLLLRADPAKPGSQKLGLLNKEGWCAHLTGDTLLLKTFAYDPQAAYPDFNVNNEVYVEGAFQELELLGPHRVVETGDSLSLSETWHLFEQIGIDHTSTNLEALDQALQPILTQLHLK